MLSVKVQDVLYVPENLLSLKKFTEKVFVVQFQDQMCVVMQLPFLPNTYKLHDKNKVVKNL